MSFGLGGLLSAFGPAQKAAPGWLNSLSGLAAAQTQAPTRKAFDVDAAYDKIPTLQGQKYDASQLDSKYGDINYDKQATDALSKSLSSYGNIIDNYGGGKAFDANTRLAQQQALQQQQGLLANAERDALSRGQYGSGNRLAMALQGSQGIANINSNQALQNAQAKQANYQNALSGILSPAGMLDTRSNQQQQAQYALQNFNANAMNQQKQFNADSAMRAQLANQDAWLQRAQAGQLENQYQYGGQQDQAAANNARNQGIASAMTGYGNTRLQNQNQGINRTNQQLQAVGNTADNIIQAAMSSSGARPGGATPAGKAHGGRIKDITLVGEEGPELVVPEERGFVIPNPKTMASKDFNVNKFLSSVSGSKNKKHIGGLLKSLGHILEAT